MSRSSIRWRASALFERIQESVVIGLVFAALPAALASVIAGPDQRVVGVVAALIAAGLYAAVVVAT